MKKDYLKTIEEINNSQNKYTIGVDECGYGAWAGPIVVCAVCVPKNWTLNGLMDSKKLSFKKRNELSEELKKQNILFSIAEYKANAIDDFVNKGKNIGYVLRELYYKSISDILKNNNFDEQPLIIIDGIHKLNNIKHYSIPKADDLFASVMAASILGKVYRDNEMIRLSEYYPDFGFENHFGYGTKEHSENIKKLGISAIHRRCYKPIKEYLGNV